MKPTTSIPWMLATALVLGTAGAVATAQDDNSENTDEQLMADGFSDREEANSQRNKRHHDKQKMAQGQRHAQRGRSAPDMMQKLFRTVDADSDGSVTQEEIDTFRSTQLSGADTNVDGALNIEEFDTIYRALTRSRMVDMFQDFDEDGDGNISSVEMDERFGQVIERLDRNDDGVLNADDRKQGRSTQ